MQSLTKRIPAFSKAFVAGRSTARNVAAVSQRGALQAKCFHSSANQRVHVGAADYQTTPELQNFPVENFDHYRRDVVDQNVNKAFTYSVVGGLGAIGASAAKNTVVDLLSSMSASADVLALANLEYDVTSIPEGTTITVKWRGKPLFIRHRTAKEIDDEASTPMWELKHPQADADRAKNPEYLVVIGVCTHLGCVPMSNAGDYNGWFCPCHGSHYDTSGRIRKGPAPLNLEIPPHKYLSDGTMFIGE
eukprot:TRINITY_DN26660_c0_g1_i1.p1 TRINITY_DN26660_c0_g1~~TRINITY_DN26660_c0_g1_i1.p1  ORF type:complete len:247 (+),score=38.52 TRINITY_DN26660_c0_g1_i1:61-801(+)